MMNFSKEIRSYAYDLVSDGKVSYAHLTEDEKRIFTGLIIKNSEPLYAHEYVTESDKKDELPYMVANLLIHSVGNIQEYSEKIDDFIDFMFNIVCQYASKRIDTILEDMEDQYNYDKKFYVE